MISYNKSKIILKKSLIKLEEEIIDTNKCLNRVTSKNIYVKSYYPSGNNAAFDGYAINSKDTKNLIDYSKLKNMKREAIVINTARGGIIKEDDLNKALNENIIFGAGLDVFEKEPIDKNNSLLKNNKVLLSPHSATFTNECKSRMSLETTKNIIDFFENKIDKSMIVKI